MIEFIIRGEEFGDLEALGIAYGLSITFRRALAIGDFDREWIYAVKRIGVWGALLLSPCPEGLPCLDDVEAAIDLSESAQMPVGYEGEVPPARPFRVSTFNKNYLKPNRWINCMEFSPDKAYLPLFACLYNMFKLRMDTPIIVSDICPTAPTQEARDFQVLPTYAMPRILTDVISVATHPIPSTAIAKGILKGGYKAGPVIVISKKADKSLIDMGGHLIDLSSEGDPCELLTKKYVGYSKSLFMGQYVVEPDLCDKCGDCFITGCDSLVLGRDGVPVLLSSCVGCGACALMCTRRAIRRVDDVFRVYLR